MNWLDRAKRAAERELRRLSARGYRPVAQALPQNQLWVSIEKIIPLPPGTEPDGWYGGKPQLPDGVSWPTDNDIPMTFFGALNCERFPTKLWGGAGPRAGWLLFFVTSTTENWDTCQCAVLHTDGSGAKKDVELTAATAENRHWLWKEDQKEKPVSAAPFPRWPLRFHEEERGEESPPRQTTDASNKAIPVYPANAKLFRLMLEEIAEKAVKQKDVFQSLAARLENDLEKASPRDQLAVETIHRGQKALRKALADLPARQEALSQMLARFSDHEGEGPLDPAVWTEFEEACKEVVIPVSRWSLVRPGRQQVRTASFEFEPALIDKPETLGEYSAQLTKVILAHSEFKSRGRQSSKIENALAGLERQLQHEISKAEGEDEQSEFLTLLRETLEDSRAEFARATEIVGDGYDRAMAARHAIGGHERHRLPMSDAEWREAAPGLAGLFFPNLVWTEVAPNVWPLEEVTIRDASPPDLLYKWHRTNLDALMFRYADDPSGLPDNVRDYLSDKYSKFASEPRDRVGGIPEGEIALEYFGDNIYLPRAERTHSVPEAPFDYDNALLLQVRYSQLPGWIFSDGGTLSFVLPFADLSAGRFDRAKAVISDGN